MGFLENSSFSEVSTELEIKSTRPFIDIGHFTSHIIFCSAESIKKDAEKAS